MILPRFTMPIANGLAVAAALAAGLTAPPAGATTTLAGVPAHSSTRAAPAANGQACASVVIAGAFRALSLQGNGSRGALRQAGWRRQAGLWVRSARSPVAVPPPRQAGPAYTVTVALVVDATEEITHRAYRNRVLVAFGLDDDLATEDRPVVEGHAIYTAISRCHGLAGLQAHLGEKVGDQRLELAWRQFHQVRALVEAS